MGKPSWSALVNKLLLGTVRSDKPLGELLQQLGEQADDRDPEIELLDAAAAYSVFKKAAGPVRQAAVNGFSEAPPETAPVCSPGLTVMVLEILEGDHRKAFPELIKIFQKVGLVLPPIALPLIEKRIAVGESTLQHVRGVIGHRGEWYFRNFSGFHPGGPNFAGLEWHTASVPERAGLLSDTGTETVIKLEWLRSDWEDLYFRDKVQLLEALGPVPDPQLEDFLEYCLDDGRKPVRQAAIRLLKALPGSGLTGRMKNRLKGSVGMENGKIRILKVQPLGKEAKRDGITSKPVREGLTEEESVCFQLLASVPPSELPATCGLQPGHLGTLWDSGRTGKVFFEGILEALLFHPAPEFSERALKLWLDWPEDPVWSRFGIHRVLAMADPASIQMVLSRQIRENDHWLECSSPLLQVLETLPAPWQDDLCMLLLQGIRKYLESDELFHWRMPLFSGVLTNLAYGIRPRHLKKVREGWNERAPLWSYYQGDIQRMITTVEFRLLLHQAVKKDGRL